MTSVNQKIDKGLWKEEPLERRLSYIANGMNIFYPDLTNALREIKRRKQRSIASNSSSGLFLCASSGVGKTHLINTLHRLWPEDHSGNISSIPTVSFTVPSMPTPNSMVEMLLKSIGDPVWHKDNAEKKYARAIEFIKKCNTEVICIDNVQDITERRAAKGITLIGSWIRRLYDDSKRLIVLFGTPEATLVVNNNKQINRRFKSRFNIRSFGFAETHEQGVFTRFIKELDKRLPLAEYSDLTDSRLLPKLFWATNGIQDYIFKLISESVENAVTQGRERLIDSDFEAGFNRIFPDQPAAVNPFSKNGLARPLHMNGEPFDGM